MEKTGFKDKVDGATASDGSKDGRASQATKKDLAGTVEEAALATGSKSAPPRKTPLICCADGLDEDTFKICKELLRPFKSSLRKLHLPKHLSTEKKMEYTEKSLTIIGDHIHHFLQKYCKAWEVKDWQRNFWKFVSLFSEKDAMQLQKLYEYIKNNQMDQFEQLYHSSEEPDSVPRLEEKKLNQLYSSRDLCRGRRDLQEHPGQRESHQQPICEVPAQQQTGGTRTASVTLAPSRKSIFPLKQSHLHLASLQKELEELGRFNCCLREETWSRENSSKRSYYSTRW